MYFINMDNIKVLNGRYGIIQLWLFFKYLDKCATNDETYKCQNGGTCSITGSGQAICNCFDQYEGLICEYGKKCKNIKLYLWKSVILLRLLDYIMKHNHNIWYNHR